jgi:hypothetical protein
LETTVVEIDSRCPSRHSPEVKMYDLLMASITIPKDHLVSIAAAAAERYLK